MKIKSNEQANELVKDGALAVEEDLILTCDFDIKANIKCRNISGENGNRWNISALNITALDITASDINAADIAAVNINAVDIAARNITAGYITARNIIAGDIIYYVLCFAYNNIICRTKKCLVFERRN